MYIKSGKQIKQVATIPKERLNNPNIFSQLKTIEEIPLTTKTKREVRDNLFQMFSGRSSNTSSLYLNLRLGLSETNS